jgi:hypothetical protein
VLSAFSGIYIFLAIAEYLLRDSYRYENSALACSVFLAVVVLISCAVIALTGRGAGVPGAGRHYLALLLIFASAILLLARLSTHPAYLVLPCVFLGVGNGLFTGLTKRYANCGENPRVISLYNIAQTLASLCAYAATLLTGWISARMGLDANALSLLAIAFTSVLAAAFFAPVARGERKGGLANAPSGG